ncbi:ATP-binding protein [Neobacillus mesonae]|uniref:ATP-binding protein n=1 Tax=Neobacillus mesonae TaxID=1193713 RepID=UPI00203F3F78|nr:ATP-binding protein [Neobacillus mesonae]MCM3569333.1 ATP-binding protein [Neobacillus mesonae]
MLLLDYIINTSIFSLLIGIPLVIASFANFKPIKHGRLLGGLYGGIVSIILVNLSFQSEGYSYDIRYAAIILSFAYFGPAAGIITGSMALITRLFTSAQWMPAITGWLVIMLGLWGLHLLYSKWSSIRKSFLFFAAYVVIYILTVPIVFHVFRDKPLFHFQYIVFVLVGLIMGVLLIESYLKLYRLNNRLSQMVKMVEESEAKYRLIAENTSDLILVINKELSGSYFSPSYEQLLGYDSCDLFNMQVCSMIHPDDTDMFRKNIGEMFQHGKSQSMEFRLQHKLGGWIEFESRCMPVKGDGHTFEQIVMISRDITERKKSEEMLLQSEKLSIVGELAAGVAHEIRNPLTTIKGFVQLYKAENSSLAYSDLLLEELERIERITSEMLSLGKPQAVQLVQADLRELLENTIDFLAPQAHMNNIQFTLEYDDSPITITCGKNQLKQVFLNLFKNAMEAMPKGGMIEIQLRKTADDIGTVFIQDHGRGIPEEMLPRLGEPFYSLKEKGTGLGLMICHKIIKQHKGTITYKSKLNEGTLVEINLPMV